MHFKSKIKPIAATLLISLVPLAYVKSVLAEIVPPTECTAWPGARWQPDPVQFGTQIESNIKVVMSDGVVLHAKVGYPTDRKTGERAAGTFPVLLSQNPYLGLGSVDKYFVKRGYIYVVAEVRGTGNSIGLPATPLPNPLFSQRQAEDGVELVHWVTQLAGGNGDVGLVGCSQLGINQIFTAAEIGPGSPIKAILPACSAHGYNSHFVGGMPATTVSLMDIPFLSFIQGFRNWSANGNWNSELHDDIVSGGDQAYNRDFWQERSTARVAGQVVENGIPALLQSGWNANEGGDALKLYAMFQNAWAQRPPFGAMDEGQEVSGRYQIILGPWGHGGGLNKGIQLAWFDTWLKGQATGLDQTTTPMHLFELKGGRWVNTSTLPITQEYSSYYPNSNGELTQSQPVGNASDTLNWETPEEGAVLSFITPPFVSDMTLAGPIASTLYASSSNTNLSLVTTLYDVAPDGTRERISAGALIGSMRATDEDKSWYVGSSSGEAAGKISVRPYQPFVEDDYLVPGKVERFAIEMSASLWLVKQGHSLQMEITSQARQEFCRLGINNLLGVASPCDYTEPQARSLTGGVYQIQRSSIDASVINLPLIAPEALHTARRPDPDSGKNKNQSLDWGSNPEHCQ